MNEEDIQRYMVQPWMMTSTDGSLPRFGVGLQHPRAYGAFARKIRRYVLDEKVLDLPAAVRSMTSLTAGVMGVEDRGTIAPGAFADVVVFDLDQVRDQATFDDAHQYSEGMVHVLVNGEFAIRTALPLEPRPDACSGSSGCGGAAREGGNHREGSGWNFGNGRRRVAGASASRSGPRRALCRTKETA